MRIIIDTDGSSENTIVSLNGARVKTLKEFHLSIHHLKKLKLQMVKEIEGQKEFISYYGDDFKKYDEVNPVAKIK